MGRKMYVAATRGPAKIEENQIGTRGETNLQTNDQSSPMRRREEHIEEQNRVNKEKDTYTQR